MQTSNDTVGIERVGRSLFAVGLTVLGIGVLFWFCSTDFHRPLVTAGQFFAAFSPAFVIWWILAGWLVIGGLGSLHRKSWSCHMLSALGATCLLLTSGFLGFYAGWTSGYRGPVLGRWIPFVSYCVVCLPLIAGGFWLVAYWWRTDVRGALGISGKAPGVWEWLILWGATVVSVVSMLEVGIVYGHQAPIPSLPPLP